VKERRYTVDEANAALATLAPLLESLREAQTVMAELQDEVVEATRSNGGGEAGRRFNEASQAAGAAESEIAELGVIVRDPSSGLVDFPAERDGEEIFLCWRLGEDAVAWWHPTDSGFAGRRPL
jgi:hypothetical protein